MEQLVLGVLLLGACCVSQYVRGYLLRFDGYGQAGCIESWENTEQGSIANAKVELSKTGRDPGHWYNDIQCESTMGNKGKVHCTRLKKHTGMHVCYDKNIYYWK